MVISTAYFMAKDRAVDNNSRKRNLRELEFVALMAFLMSNVALCIDTILPALTEIGEDLQVSNINDLQAVIITVFLGLGVWGVDIWNTLRQFR